jgi:hypothetical protein
MLNLDADFMFYAVLNCDSFLVNFIKSLGLFKPLFRHKNTKFWISKTAHYKLFPHERTLT